MPNFNFLNLKLFVYLSLIVVVFSTHFVYADDTGKCKSNGDKVSVTFSISDVYKDIDKKMIEKTNFESMVSYKARISKSFELLSNSGEMIVASVSNPSNEQGVFYFDPEKSEIVIDEEIFNYFNVPKSSMDSKGFGVRSVEPIDYSRYPFSKYDEARDNIKLFSREIYVLDESISDISYRQLNLMRQKESFASLYTAKIAEDSAIEFMKKNKVSIVVKLKLDYSTYFQEFSRPETGGDFRKNYLKDLTSSQYIRANVDCFYITEPYSTGASIARIIFSLDLKSDIKP